MRVVLTILFLLAFVPSKAGDGEYRMLVEFTLVGTKQCAHYKFDTLDACEAAKVWFVEQAAWHGRNTYECVHFSACPSENRP